MPREEFWDSTFAEIAVFLDGASDAHRDATNLAMTTAWSSELFARMKRLPDMDTVLLKKGPMKEPPPRTMEREMAVWDRFYGRLDVTGH